MYYWDKYYSKASLKITAPSNFAKFLNKKFLKTKSKILEIACGNGRDSFFFCKKNYVYAIDNSKKIIKNNSYLKNKLNIKNVKFKFGDVNKLNFKKIPKNNDLIYCRFFLHAINLKTEDKFIKSLKRLSSRKTLIALEFRTTKDELMNKGKIVGKYERITDHYRRFIETEKFKRKINEDFNIIYKIEKVGLSKTINDNPYLCRLIFKKK